MPDSLRTSRRFSLVDEIHDDGGRTPLDHQIVHSDQVGVLKTAQNGTFLEEPGDQLGIGRQFRAQDLDRDLLVGAVSNGPVHLAHGATAQHVTQLVASQRCRRRHSDSCRLLRPCRPPGPLTANSSWSQSLKALVIVQPLSNDPVIFGLVAAARGVAPGNPVPRVRLRLRRPLTVPTVHASMKPPASMGGHRGSP